MTERGLDDAYCYGRNTVFLGQDSDNFGEKRVGERMACYDGDVFGEDLVQHRSDCMARRGARYDCGVGCNDVRCVRRRMRYGLADVGLNRVVEGRRERMRNTLPSLLDSRADALLGDIAHECVLDDFFCGDLAEEERVDVCRVGGDELAVRVCDDLDDGFGESGVEGVAKVFLAEEKADKDRHPFIEAELVKLVNTRGRFALDDGDAAAACGADVG